MDQAKENPDKTTVVSKELTYTYIELVQCATYFSETLEEMYHVKKEKHIAVFINESSLLVLAILNVLKAG